MPYVSGHHRLFNATRHLVKYPFRSRVFHRHPPPTMPSSYTLSPLPVFGMQVHGIDLQSHVSDEDIESLKEDVARYVFYVSSHRHRHPQPQPPSSSSPTKTTQPDTESSYSKIKASSQETVTSKLVVGLGPWNPPFTNTPNPRTPTSFECPTIRKKDAQVSVVQDGMSMDHSNPPHLPTPSITSWQYHSKGPPPLCPSMNCSMPCHLPCALDGNVSPWPVIEEGVV